MSRTVISESSEFRVFESTPGVSVIILPDSPRYTVVTVSNGFVALTGMAREAAVGKGYFELFPKPDCPAEQTAQQNLRASFQQILTHKQPDGVEVLSQQMNIDPESSRDSRYWKVNNAPVLDESGHVSYIIHSLFEITEKVQVEEKLNSVRGIERAYEFFMNAPVIIGYVRGDHYVIELANEGLLKVWGRTKEVIGQPLLQAIPELGEQGIKPLLDNVRKTGEPFFAYELPLVFTHHGKQETVYFDFVYQPFYENDHDEIATGVISVGHDVTRQVRARQLEKSLEELKYTNANLEEFAYAASHDLKEPVRKMQFFSNRLKEELNDKLNDAQKNLFERLENASIRMQKLIDDLLEYSHAAKDSSLSEDVNLNDKIKAVMEDLELEIQKKQAKIMSGMLPTIKGNRRQMQQLFQNLISNALKYSKPGSTPEINICAKRVKGKDVSGDLPPEQGEKMFHLIEVTDNGIGFDQKDANEIFKVFTRLHGNMQYQGSGLGLSIVRKVVENHRGFVWAESNPGQGSSFKVLLPAD
jgi:signal transduction histidine kinase